MIRRRMIAVRSLALASARPLIIRAIGCYVTEFPPPINFETIVSKDNNRQIIKHINRRVGMTAVGMDRRSMRRSRGG